MENAAQQNEGFTATYSPDDNKIRVSSVERYDAETFARLKEAGYRWAPKQGIMVAPMWTPVREAIAIELAGFIGDDDSTLLDRAEDRAERFDGYSDNRASDAKSAQASADGIAGNIPFGQPILIGHHSQRRAERDAQKIENSMNKAVKMWDTAVYWEDRAAGAIAHAKYKEKPEVRARRIKKIEASKRKNEKSTAEAEQFIKWWTNPDKELTMQRATAICNGSHLSACFTLAKYPRSESASQYEGARSLWSALTDGIITVEQAKELSLKAYAAGNGHRAKWLAHYNNRLAYEKAMLGAQGGLDLIAPRARPKQLPICNYKQASFESPAMYRRGEVDTYEQIEITKAQYKSIDSDCRGTITVDNSHRMRIAIVRFKEDGTLDRWGGYGSKRRAIFLTDSKAHKKPDAIEIEAPEPPKPRTYTPPVKSNAEVQAAAAKDRAAQGVTVATGEQLFITPPELAARVIEEADIEAGHFVLEPSAGTGALIDALPDQELNITAVEQSQKLAELLLANYAGVTVHCDDFLEYEKGILPFDRIIMNPPFCKQADIAHVTHAFSMLRDGGRLVAIMSAGVEFRQDKKATAFRALVEQHGGVIEALPADSFKQSGTSVNTVLVTIDK